MNNNVAVSGGHGLSVRRLLIGFAAGTAVCFAILLISAWILLYRDVGSFAVSIISSASLCAGAFTAGLVSSRLTRFRGLLCGCASGILMFSVYYTSGLILGASLFSLLTLIRLALTLVFACAGGIVGVNSALKRKF